MPYSSLPSLNPGDPLRDSYVDQLDENLDDHETRIVALETAGGGPGDVVGPGSATNNAIVRFDGPTGALIQDSLPLVEDDGRISTVTDPTGVQDAATKNYVDTLVAAITGGDADPSQTTFLVSGGQVTWVSAYTFLVSAATYYIGGTLYQSAQQSIALDAAHASLDRIDVIAVNTSSAVVDLTGTPASTPSEPDVDPAAELKLAIVSVPAASSAPVGASNTSLYLENAGWPGELNWTSSGSGWTLGSTTNPRTGTTDIEATSISSGAYVQGVVGVGTLDPSDFSLLIFHLRSKASWSNGRTISIRFQNAGVQVGQAVAVGNGSFGFQSGTTSSYQQIAIPLVNFAIAGGTLINQIRLTRAGGGSIGFYLDDMVLQAAGSSGGGGGGITLAEADARYAPLGPNYATATGTLTADRLIIGNGTTDVEALGSAGTATTVLHGNASGAPTFSAVDLAADVTGDLPLTSLAQATAASRLLGRGSASGAGNFQEIALGTNLSMSGTTLNATAGAGGGDVTGPASSVDAEIVLFDSTSGTLLKAATGTGPVHATAGVYSTGDIDLTTEVTGALPFANLASLSASKVAGRGSASGTGDLQEITLGAGLTMSGTTLSVTGGGGGGGLVVLDEQTASASASLDFAAFITSDYETYVFELIDVLPATSTADLRMRMGTGGGPTFDSGANYTWAFFQHSQLPNTANLGGSGQTFIKLANSLGNGATNGVSGRVSLFNPESTVVHKRVTAQLANVDSSGNFVDVVDAGQYVSTTAVTGVQFLMSSGNIASGTIRVYGVAIVAGGGGPGGDVDLEADVTGQLPFANIAPLAASKLAGRGSASGTGDIQEITLGSGLSMSGTTISASGSTRTAAISLTIDGAGSVITTGVKGFVSVPQSCTITGARVLSTDASVTSGSIVVDVWKDTYANYPPTVADTITASAKPTLSSATKSNDVTLTGWTTALTAGDVVGFKVDSVSTVTRVLVELTVSVP